MCLALPAHLEFPSFHSNLHSNLPAPEPQTLDCGGCACKATGRCGPGTPAADLNGFDRVGYQGPGMALRVRAVARRVRATLLPAMPADDGCPPHPGPEPDLTSCDVAGHAPGASAEMEMSDVVLLVRQLKYCALLVMHTEPRERTSTVNILCLCVKVCYIHARGLRTS